MAPRLRAGAYFASLDNLSIPDSARMEAGGRLARTALERSRCLKPFCGIGLLGLCAIRSWGSWGGRRPRRGGDVTGMGATDGAAAAGGR